MFKGFDSFYNDVNYDEVKKTQHTVMCATWGTVQLENAMPTKRIDIKLADNKPILTLYWMLLKTAVQRDTAFFLGLKQIMITRLLTDSNPSSHRGWGQRSTSRITSFRSINIPVAISHYSFYLKVMDDWQTQNNSVGCILHLPSLIHKLWKLWRTYDSLQSYEFVSGRSKINLWKTYDKLRRNFRLFVNWAPGQKSDLVIRIGDPDFL